MRDIDDDLAIHQVSLGKCRQGAGGASLGLGYQDASKIVSHVSLRNLALDFGKR
jgi:hypothetical protein